MEKSSFAARHSLDNGFWLVFVATSWLAVAMGFWAPVAERYAGKAPYVAPLILVVHVFVYFAWLVLPEDDDEVDDIGSLSQSAEALRITAAAPVRNTSLGGDYEG